MAVAVGRGPSGQACFDENDSLAWAEFLRSPLCGLSLQSIMKLSPKRKYETFLGNLQNMNVIASLTQDEKAKVERVANLINQSKKQFFRKSVVNITKGLFIELKGLSVIRNENDKESLKLYFSMLESFGFDLPAAGEVDSRVDNLYAEDAGTENPVKIMTIHKAKGLEFDYVFIPQCHKGTRGDDAQLMVSDVLISGNGEIKPVVAPLIKDQENSVYSFVRLFSKLKKQNEVVRTAYVALTRAKVKTFLSGADKVNIKGKSPQFVKGSYFSFIDNGEFEAITINCKEATYEKGDGVVNRRVLKDYASSYLPESKILAAYRGVENINNDILPALNANETWKSSIGTVIHAILENISKAGINNINIANINVYKEQWRLMLLEEGVPSNEVVGAIKYIGKCVGNILSDEKGMFILGEHESDHHELALNIKESGKLKTIVIDRAFIDNDTQYIVDYKSGDIRKGERESEFIDRMLVEHTQQMETYSKALYQLNGIKQVVGLYLLSIGRFVTYDDQMLLAA